MAPNMRFPDDIRMVKSYLKFIASKGYNTFLFICLWELPTAIRKVKQNWKQGPFYNDNDTDNDNDNDNNNCRFNQFKHCHWSICE